MTRPRRWLGRVSPCDLAPPGKIRASAPASPPHPSRRSCLVRFLATGLEEEREAEMLPRPRRHDRLRPMLRAPVARKLGEQFGRGLHRIQVPPPPLSGAIGQVTDPIECQPDHAATDVRKSNPDSSIFELQVDRFHSPGVIKAEHPGAVRKGCFHPGNLLHQPPLRSTHALRIPEEPKNRTDSDDSRPARNNSPISERR